jgi:hypothetical protein
MSKGQKGKAFISGRDAPVLEVAACGFKGIEPGGFRCPQMLLTPIAPGPGAEQDHLLDPVAKSGYQAGLGFVQDFVAFFQPSFFVLRVSLCPFHTNPIALTAQEELSAPLVSA